MGKLDIKEERPDKETRKDKAKKQKETIKPKSVEYVLNVLWNNYYSVLKIENPRIWGRVSYTKIVEKSGIEYKGDLIWIKFAKDKDDSSNKRYVGTVGAGYDINDYWNNENMSGMLVKHAGLVWDDSLVLVIPIRMRDGKTRSDFERAIGDLLIKNDVPVIDYYSHHF